MDTITRPLADTNPAVVSLKAKIDATTAELGRGPASVVTALTGGKRTADLAFGTATDLIAWISWLHCPWANSIRGGRLVYVAYKQWAGFACTLTADEALDPAPAAG